MPVEGIERRADGKDCRCPENYMNASQQTTKGFNLIFIHSSLDDAGLNPKEFRVFAHLSRRASSGSAWPSIKTIAEVCKISEPRVRLALKTLTDRRFISVEIRPGRTFLWTINSPDKWLTPVGNDTPDVSVTPVGNDTTPLSETTPHPPLKTTGEGYPLRVSTEGSPIAMGFRLEVTEAVKPPPSLTPTQKRLGRLFSRREETPWSEKEIKALKGLPQITDEDWKHLEAFYSAKFPEGKDYRKRKLITLLNDFTGALDMARKYNPAKNDQPW